jgi:ABC-type uncharacterized transport system permease subunit
MNVKRQLPDAKISHSIPHRLRIKIPSKKGNTSFLSSVKDQFVGLEGIEKVEINTVTGSILLIHHLDSRTIADYAVNHDLFRIEDPETEYKQTVISRRISETFKDLNKTVTASTKGFANVPDLLVLVLIGLSAYQISQGNFMAPAWYTAVWYALNIFLKSQPESA